MMKIQLALSCACCCLCLGATPVALETTPSLTNAWTEVKLKADSVDVDPDGHIIIQHQSENQDQGYYILQSVK